MVPIRPVPKYPVTPGRRVYTTLRGGVSYVLAEGGLHQGVALVAVRASATRDRKRLVGFALEWRFTPSLCIPLEFSERYVFN